MKFGERFGIAIMSAWGLFAVHQGVNALVRAHNWQPMTISDWGTWIGSIGTVATLAGTIWLATTDSRRRHKESILVAQIHAAGLYWKLTYIRETIFVSIRELKALDISDVGRLRKVTDEDLHRLTLWTVGDLLPLVPLGNNLVENLAQAEDTLDWAKSMFSRTRLMTAEQLMRFLPPIVPMLEISHRLMDSAIKECEKATQALGQRRP
jgi:hypothetical protein